MKHAKWIIGLIAIIILIILLQPKKTVEYKKEASITPLAVKNIESMEIIGVLKGIKGVTFDSIGDEILASYEYPANIYSYPLDYSSPRNLRLSISYSGDDVYTWYSHMFYDGGQEKWVYLPYAGPGSTGVVFGFVADDGSVYANKEMTGLITTGLGEPNKVKFRTSNPTYYESADEWISFNQACGSTLNKYKFKYSTNRIGSCVSSGWSFVMGSLPGTNLQGAPQPCITNLNLYYDSGLSAYWVCCDYDATSFHGAGYILSGTETSFSIDPSTEVVCEATSYSQFLGFKNLYLSGSDSLSTFISNANKWVGG